MHSGNGDVTDLERRFVECFVQAADDAGLPADPEFRTALRAYMEWAVVEINAHPETNAMIPAGLAMPMYRPSHRRAGTCCYIRLLHTDRSCDR
jgi:hemoglobin